MHRRFTPDELDQMNLIADLTKEEYLGFVQREVALLASCSMDELRHAYLTK